MGEMRQCKALVYKQTIAGRIACRCLRKASKRGLCTQHGKRKFSFNVRKP